MTDEIESRLDAEHVACLSDAAYRERAVSLDAQAAARLTDITERERGLLHISRHQGDWTGLGGPDLALDQTVAAHRRWIIGALAGTVEWRMGHDGWLTREDVERALDWAAAP